MKKFIVCLTVLFLVVGVFAQPGQEGPLAKKATEALKILYNLDSQQQAEMLKIQARKYRNLDDIKQYKAEDPQKYIQKVQALQYGNDWSIQKLLNKDQLAIFKEQQTELREKKALVYKEMKTAGTPQPEIDKRMFELDLESLQQ